MTRGKRRYGALPLLMILWWGCGEEPAPPTPARTYTVRGLVRQVPVADRPASELLIHHEAIPDFVDDRGSVVGMDAMSMPFPVSGPSILEGIAPGDRVEFDLHVQWGGSPPVVIDRLAKLPEGTRLAFERVAPPQSPQGDEGVAPPQSPQGDEGVAPPQSPQGDEIPSDDGGGE